MKFHQQLWPVEALRGLAALMVVAAHLGPPAGWNGAVVGFAFTGVDLFFVLSGFVFAPYWLKPPPLNWRAYALRRIFRIYPAYLVGLAVMAAWISSQNKPLLYLPEHLLMIHLQSREMTFYYNPVFWSLPAEAWFYAILPIFSSWLGGQTRRLLWLGFAVLVIRLWLMWAADPEIQNMAYIALHNLPGIALEFSIGIAARAYSTMLQHRPGFVFRRPTSRVFFLAIAWLYWLILAYAFDIAKKQQWGFFAENFITLLSTLCFALTLVTCILKNQKTSNDSATTPYSFQKRLGLIAGALSYSVYLLHIIWLHWATYWELQWGKVFAFGTALLGLGLTALALHHWVEAPARRWGRKLANRLEFGDQRSCSK